MVKQKYNLQELEKRVLRDYSLDSLVRSLLFLERKREKVIGSDKFEKYRVIESLGLVNFSKTTVNHYARYDSIEGWVDDFDTAYNYEFTDEGERILLSLKRGRK